MITNGARASCRTFMPPRLTCFLGAAMLTCGIPIVQTQGANIRSYSDYLLERVRGYRDTKTDYVRVGAGKLKKLSVDKGLLRETEAVQNQIGALVKCDVGGHYLVLARQRH